MRSEKWEVRSENGEITRETPRAVLFDLDDTLFDHRGTSREALAAVQAAVPDLARCDLDEFERRHVAVLEELHHGGVMQGEMSMDEARVERFRRLLAAAGSTGSDAGLAARRYREAYIAARRAVPGAGSLLRALRPVVRLGIVTNNILSEQEDKLKQLGLRHLIDVLVASAEEGVSKPDPAIFLRALHRLGHQPGEAVMVGDSWATDVVGARAAGLRVVWFNQRGEHAPEEGAAVEIATLEPAQTVAALILASGDGTTSG